MLEFFAVWALLLLVIHWLKHGSWWDLVAPAVLVVFVVRLALY